MKLEFLIWNFNGSRFKVKSNIDLSDILRSSI